jgi:hypothetical protein
LKDYRDGAATPEAEKKPAESAPVLAQKILTELETCHHFFADLLELFAETDYRTLATAVGELHAAGKIAQDGDGKYQVI